MSIPDSVPVGMALHYATEEQRVEAIAKIDASIGAVLAARRHTHKLHIRGPLVGGLWVCRLPSQPDRKASGTSPECAYNAWYTMVLS
jgi:hypothetical protein